MTERLGIVGSGAIASGLARLAAPLGDVVVWARSERSAEAARERIGDGATVVTDLAELSDRTFLVEAVIEERDTKTAMLGELSALAGEDAVLTSTTSSLSIEELAAASRRPERFAGLHVFNPVEKMPLVEIVFPAVAEDATRERCVQLCEALGKTAVEVPDVPGFVVNRLLFPYLFSAVRLMEETGMDPNDIDTCMKLGAGHPMGPLALLDLVGLDVSKAIGEEIGADIPETVQRLVSEGKLGRKTGAGLTL